MIYAEHGINWIFIYEVQYEDECILILKDLGRYHKYDEDRKYDGKIDKHIDIVRGSMGDMAVVDKVRKLVEVK